MTSTNLTDPAGPGTAGTAPRVGMFLPTLQAGLNPDTAATARLLAAVSDAGLDHVCVGDHVSFAGFGFDGLTQAAVLAALHPTLPVHTGVYLLPLRHPVLVARQIADLGRVAPGRLVFGVGIGGEDRHEVAICGVDPATRGRRMNEALTALRRLLTGEPASCYGEFYGFEDAVIAPAPAPPVPIIVGGRSDVAIRRAGRLGDGWLGIWNSPRRYAAAVQLAADEAGQVGRADPPQRHAMQVWCGLAGSREQARDILSTAMQGFYGLPFERFERYSPYGTPADVAEFLAGYVAEGCTEFNLIPQGLDPEETIAAAAEVKRLLAGRNAVAGVATAGAAAVAAGPR
jgi:alkanesulfonate monooxygenase SsuD/methylene tetrahydromethanopterin reductase-like flavin-dependent oxidoreductase (luciferase family)